MNSIIRIIKNVFRNKGKNIALMAVLTICFMLGILMINVYVLSNSQIEYAKQTLGTKLTLQVSEEYLKEFFKETKGSEQYSEIPYFFSENVVDEILADQHILNAEKIVVGTFQSEDLLSPLQLLWEEQDKFTDFKKGGKGKALPGENDRGDFTERIYWEFPIIGVSNLGNLVDFETGRLELVEGEYFEEYDVEKNVCVVSNDFADANNLTLGSSIVVNGWIIHIKGIFENVSLKEESTAGELKMAGLDNIYIPIKTSRTLLSLEDDALNIVGFTADSYDNVNIALEEAEATIEESGFEEKLIISSNTAQFETTISSIETVKSISLIGLFSAFGAGFIIVLSSMFVSVRGRAREIGTLKAIGFSNSGIIKQFLIESLTICTIALLISLILISLTNNFLINNIILKVADTGADQAAMYDWDMQQLAAPNIMANWQTSMDYKTILYALLASMLACLAGTAIPAISIARLRPADVIRFE